MSDSHQHSHHDHHHADAGPRLIWALLLTLGFAAVEAVVEQDTAGSPVVPAPVTLR